MSTILSLPKDVFLERGIRALQSLADSLDTNNLLQALAAPTDTAVLGRALSRLESLGEADPLLPALLRGMNAKRELLQSEGGSVSGAEVAKLLKISRQAVDKRRLQGKLIAVELGKKGFYYPVWQVGLSGLEEVLEKLYPHREAWGQILFFLNPQGMLDGKTPLEVLRGRNARTRIEAVARAAEALNE